MTNLESLSNTSHLFNTDDDYTSWMYDRDIAIDELKEIEEIELSIREENNQ